MGYGQSCCPDNMPGSQPSGPSHPDPAALLTFHLTLVAERKWWCPQSSPCPTHREGAESSTVLSRKQGTRQEPAPDRAQLDRGKQHWSLYWGWGKGTRDKATLCLLVGHLCKHLRPLLFSWDRHWNSGELKWRESKYLLTIKGSSFTKGGGWLLPLM